MSVITSRFTIDGADAINNINLINGAFTRYNAALGQLSATTASFNGIGNQGRQVLTQIAADGTRTRTVVAQLNGVWQILSTRVDAATQSQLKNLAVSNEQARIASNLARTFGGSGPVVPPPRNPVPGVTPTAGGLAGISQALQGFAKLTTAQIQAAAAAQHLNATQTRTFQRFVAGAGEAAAAIDRTKQATDAWAKKLSEVNSIAFATLIYRGISLIQQGLKEGITTSVEYSRQIGLIQTISQDSGESFGSWNEAITKVANNLGRPVTEVATAAYDALSNQVIRTTKDFGLLETAITLERNTNAPTGTGLNVLSALMNGMGKSASEAALLADKLFVTVDVGRVRLQELDKTLGRTIGLQRQAGASFDETAAAIAVLTQSGIDSAEATTLLNNVYAELIKPNKELTEVFLKLGFTSSESAVGTLGLVGVMRELDKASKNTKDGLATLLPDIRGLRGGAILTGQGLDQLSASLEKIRNAKGANIAAKAILDKNPGQQLLDESNRLKNFFTVDLGVGVINTLAQITQAFGGLANVLRRIKDPVIELGILIGVTFAAAAIIKYYQILTSFIGVYFSIRAAITGTVVAQNTLNASIAAAQVRLGIFFGSFAIGYFGAEAILNHFIEKQRQAFDLKFSFPKGFVEAEIESVKQAATRRVEVFNRSIEEMKASYGSLLAAAKIINNKFIEGTEKLSAKISESLRNAADIVLTFAKKNVNAIEAEFEKAATAREKATKHSEDIVAKLEEEAFRDRLELIKKRASAIDEANSVLAQRAGVHPPVKTNVDDALGRAVRERDAVLRYRQNTAIHAGDQDKAQDILNQRFNNLDELKSTANSHGFDIAPAKKAILREYNAEIERSITLQEKDAVSSLAGINSQRENYKVLEDQLAKIVDFRKQVFETSGPNKGGLTDAFRADPRQALSSLKELQNEVSATLDNIKIPTNKVLAAQLSQAIATIKSQFPQQLNALANQITAAQNDKAIEERNAANKASLEQQLALHNKINEAITTNTTRVGENVKAIAGLSISLENALTSFGQGASGRDKAIGLLRGGHLYGAGADNRKQGELASTYAVELQKQLQDGVSSPKKILETFQKLKEASEGFKENFIIDPKDSEKFVRLGDALDSLENNIRLLKENSGDLKDAYTNLQNFANASSGIQTKTLEDTAQFLREIGTNAASLNAGVPGLDALTAADLRLRDAANAAAAAQERLNRAAGVKPGAGGGAGGAAEPRAGGGVVGSAGGFLADFYSGKFARGTDNIPVMMTRDEFVVRAPMAKKFFSQLIAINNDQVPRYRAEGGSVSGGDTVQTANYHINVSGGGDHKQLAKTVVSAIKRARSQGTVKF